MRGSILINGVNYSWANLQLIFLGLPLVGITKISYGRKRDVKFNHGAGDEAVSVGYGNFTYAGSITISTDEARQLSKSAPNGSFLEIPLFSAKLIYSGDGVNYATDKLSNIALMADDFNSDQGNTGMWQTIPFVFQGLEKITQ